MDAAILRKPNCLWKPDRTKKTNLDTFRDLINKKYGQNLQTYKELHRWSVDHYPEFWGEVWDFTNIKYSRSYNQVYDATVRMDEFPPKWFSGALFNFAENLLKHEDEDKVAIYAAVEGHDEIKRRTFRELKDDVALYASAMRKMGIGKNDRVVGYIPNCIEAIVAMLAAVSLGAIWSSASPDFGVTGVLERFCQISPKFIISVNGVIYNGKTYEHLTKLSKVANVLPEVEKVVVIPYLKFENGSSKSDLSFIRNACSLEEFLESGRNSDGTVDNLIFEQLPFDHPVFIMYSSGTTGVPKCIVHSAGGTLIKHLEEHALQGDMRSEDRMLYYTTTGWMMWNWFVSPLAIGASLVCYDGSPLVPNQNILWDLIDKLGITILGTGAKWLAVLEERDIKPMNTHKLTTLRSILSTGSPLSPKSFRYVYEHVKKDILLGSITGGTDIIACFAGQNCTLPVYEGEIQSVHLGVDMVSLDEDGKEVYGESGDLVCRKPFPSMPIYFWNDPKNEKYRKAYYDKYDGMWAHGDFCLINPKTDGIWMLGRSDGTLNPNGVRFGSSEIYQIVEEFKEIADSLCIGQKSADGNEERVVLFLKMAQGSDFNEDLKKRLQVEIRMQLSARHVPSIILSISDIPYTNSGKKVEVAVKKILAGEDVKSRGAYINPNSLDLYYNIKELQNY
ncbi:DgyrCDS14202 [Dimorphilus gyrociliatus]|uniref:Acetoacetyl-CoA synthetase n=1 Tax=Dimorphilus gyrociliatus TaxID=2664684 RepID=A0A7I8WCY5_9ANNE|nr:DgyrCDS14202 [Dimorphilus gyrociliatus]